MSVGCCCWGFSSYDSFSGSVSRLNNQIVPDVMHNGSRIRHFCCCCSSRIHGTRQQTKPVIIKKKKTGSVRDRVNLFMVLEGYICRHCRSRGEKNEQLLTRNFHVKGLHEWIRVYGYEKEEGKEDAKREKKSTKSHKRTRFWWLYFFFAARAKHTRDHRQEEEKKKIRSRIKHRIKGNAEP